MDREEEVGLLVVGDRRPVVERDHAVGVARQDDAAGEQRRGRVAASRRAIWSVASAPLESLGLRSRRLSVPP